jgi:DNA gyrase/topoisomerase IV subunit A
VDDARAKLIKRYSLSELQANAILEMQLRRLAALERKKIEQEYKDILALIKTSKICLPRRSNCAKKSAASWMISSLLITTGGKPKSLL